MNRSREEEKKNPNLFKQKPKEEVCSDFDFVLNHERKPNPKEPLKHKHLPPLPKQKDS